MRLPRILFAVFFTFVSVVPAVAQGTHDEQVVDLAADVSRDTSERATRGAERTAVVEPLTTTSTTSTTVAPATSTTTSTAPPTTAAPTTTTTQAKARPAAVSKSKQAEEVPAGSGGKQDVVRIARAQVGKAYVAGGNGPSSFDCSGLVFYVFNQAGISVPRLTSDTYFSNYAHVSRAELQPGDLVVSRGHIGIYVGNGQMVHASTPRGGVKLAPIDVVGPPIGYARI